MPEDRGLARCLALAAVGGALMFAAHLLGLLGWMASEGREMRPPYWWGYPILYPLAAAVAVRATRATWLTVALCLCALPVIYFLAHAVIDGAWDVNDGAVWGIILTLAVTALVAFCFRDRARGGSVDRDAVSG